MQRQEQSSTPLPSSSRRIAGAGSIDAHSVYAPPHSRFTRRAGDGRVGGWRQRAAAMRGQTIFGGAWWRVTPSDLWFELRHYLSQRASLTRHTAPTYNKQCVCLCGRCGPVANRLSIGRSGGSVHAHTYAYIWWRQGPGCSMVYCTWPCNSNPCNYSYYSPLQPVTRNLYSETPPPPRAPTVSLRYTTLLTTRTRLSGFT